MSQTITEDTRLGSSSTGRIINVGLWILQIATAAMFLMAGFGKLSSDPWVGNQVGMEKGGLYIRPTLLSYMVLAAGFEPATSSFGGKHSIH
jgi:uncharacterized membrane protein YphA (DoxX/SURF4 family)